MSHRTHVPVFAHADVEHRLNVAAEILADGLLNLVLREKRAELESLDAERAAEADERARTEAPKAVRRGRGRGRGAFSWR